jgi:hypothetical protein
MARSWNGKDLLDEFTALLGDTSSIFRKRCLGWLNDVQADIATRHDWGYHLTKGKKRLIERQEMQSLEINPPAAPTLILTGGGELAPNATYRVLITLEKEGGAESQAGTPSEPVITDSTNLSLEVFDIGISDEDTVSARRIYLQKNNGEFFLAGRLEGNFNQSFKITKDTASTIEPPDYEAIRKLKGAPFFESPPSRTLVHRDIDQLRLMFEGAFTVGNPEYFSPLAPNVIVTYPLPADGLEVSFNYYRFPRRIYDSVDSQPDLPINLKQALKAGVVAMGYEYRDRAGQETKKANYENALVDAINRGGRVADIQYFVRDVYGGLSGFEVG